MGLVAIAIAALVIGIGAAAGRLAASRAFGIRGFRRSTNSEAERGRPALAFARAGAGIEDGDRILKDWPTLKSLVAAHPDATIEVVIDRAGEKKTFSVMKQGPSTFLRLAAGITSYWAVFADLALLVVALVMSVLPKRNSALPTSGDSS